MTAFPPKSRYRFGRFELQLDDRLLLESGHPLEVSPRGFDLLVALIEQGGRLATKAYLLQRVWPGVVVEENSLQAQVSALRKTLGPNTIATVVGSGYRLVPEVFAAGRLPPNNLPQSATSFVGRVGELAEVRAILRHARLLCLTGTGGCGKTRMALEATKVAQDMHPDGIWLVELATLQDPLLVPHRLAGVMGLLEVAGKRLVDLIVEQLKSSRTLIVLDNAEHLRSACSELARELLTGTEHVSIVVTSRQRLGVEGEVTYRVPSLSIPDAKRELTPESVLASESVKLFVDRARILQPDFSVTENNAATLSSICRRLDGIALAIELAAPRVCSMSLEEIDRRLNRRFSLLTTASSEVLPRQRTLRSLIDWSYELLMPAEQALLCRLSVFSGGWTLQAATAVCSGQEIDPAQLSGLLASLVEKSLVLREERGGHPRYGFLETIRQYALDRLGEEPLERAARTDAHLVHFAALAEVSLVETAGENQVAWFDLLEAEHDNMRAALAWSLGEGKNPKSGMDIAGSIWRFWSSRGLLEEGLGWTSRCLPRMPIARPRAALETC